MEEQMKTKHFFKNVFLGLVTLTLLYFGIWKMLMPPLSETFSAAAADFGISIQMLGRVTGGFEVITAAVFIAGIVLSFRRDARSLYVTLLGTGLLLILAGSIIVTQLKYAPELTNIRFGLGLFYGVGGLISLIASLSQLPATLERQNTLEPSTSSSSPRNY